MDALATVTGIVDGTGSFGAAIGQVSYHVHTNLPACHWFRCFALVCVHVVV